MDPITTLRSTRGTEKAEPDYGAARAALQRRIEAERGRTGSTSRARALGISGIGIAVAAAVGALAIVITSGTFSPVDPKSASAAELLTQAADGLAIMAQDQRPEPGDYLRYEVTDSKFWVLDESITPGGQEFPFFNDRGRTGATAGLEADAATVHYYPGDVAAEGVTEHLETDITPYGDESAAMHAWEADRASGRYPPNPGSTTWQRDWTDDASFHVTHATDVAYADAPADPQALLDWWGAQERNTWEAERAMLSPEEMEAIDFPDAPKSAARSMIEAMTEGQFGVVAPAEFRERVLRALALAPDVALVGQDGDLARFDVTHDDESIQLTIDTKRGIVTQIDVFNELSVIMADGTLGQGIPDFSMRFEQEIVSSAPGL